MEVKIANPIYDVVFKYMMDDHAAAKLLISSIIGEEVTELDARPQEHAVEIPDPVDAKKTLTVYRLDFAAKIKTDDGFRTVLIELQKASLASDIMRFRGYLGRQIANPDNSIEGEDKKLEPIRIYAIYFLGEDLKICDTPVLCVSPVVVDMATKEVVEKRSKFIEMLNHKCWIIQISCLKQRRRNELEKLLHVFDQSNRTSDNHILNVREDDFPEKFRPLIRRLQMAASDHEVKHRMEQEDIHLRYVQNVERAAHHKGLAEGLEKGEAIGLEKGETIGLEKGKIEIALRMLKKGKSVEDISDTTGLSIQQIEELMR